MGEFWWRIRKRAYSALWRGKFCNMCTSKADGCRLSISLQREAVFSLTKVEKVSPFMYFCPLHFPFGTKMVTHRWQCWQQTQQFKSFNSVRYVESNFLVDSLLLLVHSLHCIKIPPSPTQSVTQRERQQATTLARSQPGFEAPREQVLFWLSLNCAD